MDLTGFFGIIVFLVGIVFTIVWIVLPFAVFGINKRLDILINQAKKH